MTRELRAGTLPTAVRRAAIASLLLSGAVGFWSASETVGLLRFAELKEAGPSAILSPAASILEKGLLKALEPMRVPRVLTLGALAIVCTLSMVCVGRLFYPAGLARERIRRLLVDSTLAAALLRTIDGAQGAAVARKVAISLAVGNADSVHPMIPSLAAGVTIAVTGFVVLSFTLLSQYFRSRQVQEVLAATERRF